MTLADWACDDLLLLAVRGDGKLAVRKNLHFGVAGAELIRLTACGRIAIEDGRIVLLDAAPTGDELLDDALNDITYYDDPPEAGEWVFRSDPGLVKRYLARLETAGAVSRHKEKVLGLFSATRWTITDPGRRAQAQERLDAFAEGVDDAGYGQRELAAVTEAIGLAMLLYPEQDLYERIQAAAEDSNVARAIYGAFDRRTDEAVNRRSSYNGSDAGVGAAIDVGMSDIPPLP